VATEAPGRVVVVGAGPTGLALAGELAVGGAECLVLERRAGPRTGSRAICLHARSMEMLDLRGQAEAFARAGLPLARFPLGLPRAWISFRHLDSDFPYLLDIPQSQIEELLGAWARRAGARVEWSRQVISLDQDDGEVRVTCADGTVERAAYVVACDGAHSLVRESLRIPFPGAPNPGSVILADLFLDGLPAGEAYGDLSERGVLLVLPFRDGSVRAILYDYARAEVPTTEPVTLSEVAAGLRAITGRDLGPRDMYWQGRYRSESRQAARYRSGRVFLAGDAAHTHSPAGAQGLNTGLQDAMNLGWKLAAELAGRAPGWLLDTYQSERHPVGAAVLTLSGRQFRLNTARSPQRRVARWAAQRLAAPLPPVQSWLARTYSGVAVRYPAGDDAHPMVGARLPRGHITLPGGSVARVPEVFHDGKFVLLEREDATGAELPACVRAVTYTRSTARLPATMLIRPDGYVAWASGQRDPALRRREAARAAARWCTPG
jgi:2-polyprenyl-6-methoxyphenol hydroxylase-like FAD-dependent oxidoreductase